MLSVFRLLKRQSDALPMVKPPEGGRFKACQNESWPLQRRTYNYLC